MKKLALTIALYLSVAHSVVAQEGSGAFEDAARACVQTEDPEACLTTYGFDCHGSPASQTAVDAYRIGCNAPTGDGRLHFVQMLEHGGEWTIEASHSYDIDYGYDDEPGDDPNSMLAAYVQERMADHHTQSSGTADGSAGLIDFVTGVRREDGVLILRGVCGSVIRAGHTDRHSADLLEECERWMLRSMRMLGPTPDHEPFRIASVQDISWESAPVSVSANVDAYIVEGRLALPAGHRPCRYVSGCCSQKGTMYLQNCREPNETELVAISACLEDRVPIRTPEFEACLRDQDIRVGCELQPDGSSICY